ncbi:MAG: cold shock domain-containing protein [Desulfuromonadaceae bacterium]|nr:cold shock domain-containing protein [Desulfuromonadaceae bacterium]
MQGTVKWFSQEKGFGFIVDSDGNDLYFNVQGIKGATLPGNGDVVSYDIGKGKKGPIATSVTIIQKKEVQSRNTYVDSRVTCSKCNRAMVPRVVLKYGSPDYSICPYCGDMYKAFWCFITTTVCNYRGLPDDCYELQTLRRFRDEHLLSTEQGSTLVKNYYDVAPSIAARLINKDDLENTWEKICQCIADIESNQFDEAVVKYSKMVAFLQQRLLSQ